MARYEVHRTDGNATRLYAYLEVRGASVVKLDKPLDAAVSFRGATALVEVKMPGGKLRASQRAFLRDWQGLTAILRSEADCDVFLGQLAKLATHAR